MPKIYLPKSGHAPSHLREAFLESLDHGTPDLALARRLWNCTDIMPGYNCSELDLPRGSTYAQVVRHLVQESRQAAS